MDNKNIKINQKIINAIYDIALTIHRNKWFIENEKNCKKCERKELREVVKWIAYMIKEQLDIYTIPIGSLYGVIIDDEEKFEKYWNEEYKNDYF